MKKQLLHVLIAGASLLGAAPPHESPFACDRTALNREQRKRHFEERGPQLRALVQQVRELRDGYEFQFPGDPASLRRIAEWTLGEHLCCPFFDIDLRLDREGGAAWIRLTGRAGTKEFIRADFRPWFRQ
ncbi:MAG TPA: hypothetical protein VNH18_29745 [Bryobacteraceae bacterium]|nr:hypothetical protein [Bryobacteraceae bacterium]